MSDTIIDLDEFSAALGEILDRAAEKVPKAARKAVREGLKKGEEEWRSNAPVNRGKYKDSIKNHMIRDGGDTPTGEIGSPKMPGLPHLLEKGHAKVGGGRVAGIPHIAPAAEVAFDETEKRLIEALERAFR